MSLSKNFFSRHLSPDKTKKSCLDFLASDFIASDELPPILRKAEEDGTRILPLIVAPCEFEDSELGDFQAINSPDRTLADLGDDRAAINRVYLELNKEIKSLIG